MASAWALAGATFAVVDALLLRPLTYPAADRLVLSISAVVPQRYERILLRDTQPRNQSWDGRWVYELQPQGDGTVLRITEYGWTDGVPFFLIQRVLGSPDAFLKHYASAIGTALGDPATIQVLRSH